MSDPAILDALNRIDRDLITLIIIALWIGAILLAGLNAILNWRTKPVGVVRRERPGEIRHSMPGYVGDREGGS